MVKMMISGVTLEISEGLDCWLVKNNPLVAWKFTKMVEAMFYM